MMNRREAIQRTVWLLGGALSAPALAGVLGGCRAGGDKAAALGVLAPEQQDLVASLAEYIIPETDTPGARAARVDLFVDRMLAGWFPADERDHFLNGLAAFDARCEQENGAAFLDCTPEQQAAFLGAMDAEAFGQAPSPGQPPPFFRTMKELTLLGYYTSEVGAMQELQWSPAPGSHRGCVPLGEAGKGRTWA